MTPRELLALRAQRQRAEHARLDAARRAEPVSRAARRGHARPAGRGAVRQDERHRRARGDHRVAAPRGHAGDDGRAAVEQVLWAFRERVQDLKRDRRFRYIIIFKNHGAAAGASLEHSHSQLIALPIVPREVRDEVDGARAALPGEGALRLLRHPAAGDDATAGG